MWGFFIHNNRFGYLFVAVITAVGLYTMSAIPRESSPEVVIPVGIVTTVLPGAPAADVESLVTNKIERGLTSLENVKKITSASRESVSSIVVEFEASANVDSSIEDLKNAVDILVQDLPSDAEDPTITEVDFVNQPILTFALAGNIDDFGFTVLADKLTDILESVPGVSRVSTQGVQEREVTVIVNQTALTQFNISLDEITNALRTANTTFPIGQIEYDGVSYNIAFEGDITNADEIAHVAITTRGGQPVFIRDVATVNDGLTPAKTISRLSQDGKPSKQSISFDVYKQSGGDITAIANDVNAKIVELQTQGGLLDGVTSSIILDAGEEIESDLAKLTRTGIETIILVMITLILTIGWREGVLAALSIPLSFFIGFIGLYYSGNTINFLSLFSMILGIGILVDTAIVVVEGINRRMKENPDTDHKTIAIETIQEFASPIISGTLTTVAMFAGLFIVSGVIGQFIASIPFTLIFLLLASMFVSLAILPLFTSSILKPEKLDESTSRRVRYTVKLELWYKDKLSNIVGNRSREKRFQWSIRLALVCALLLPVFGFVKVVFFETTNAEYVIVEIEKPEGTTKEVTDIAVRRVEEVLYKQSQIESFVVTIGSGNQFGGGGTGEKLANIFVLLKEDRDETSTEIMETLRTEYRAMRDLKISVSQLSDGPPTGAAIIVKFLGEDLTNITQIANESAEILKGIEHTTNVETSTNNNSTEFVLTLDKAKASALGLNPFTISQIARIAVFGSDATSLTTLTDDIDVVVKLNVGNNVNVSYDNTNQASIDALSRINIPTQNGDVPLSSLVSFSLRESSAVINHEENKRVVSVTADVTTEGNAREIQAAALAKIKKEISIPDSVTISTGGGESEESNKAFMEMLLALVVGILLMVGILVLEFNSYRHTMYVLSIIPYSLIGIMAGLALTGNSLSFPSIMGFIALTGIVVNNSILLIDMMNSMRKTNPEKSIHDVVVESSARRLRPILLTTVTTVVGMIPLTYAGDLWAPLAYAVIFGLIFSVLITLVLVPILYSRNPGELG